jgi:hypothetical protein
MIIELYKEDGFEPRRASAREYQGPCPACGGNDRFCLYPDQGTGLAEGMGSYHCGHGQGGAGCNRGGDCISYLKEFRGLSFGDACQLLGIDAGRPQTSTRYRAPRRKASHAAQKQQPADPGWPDYVHEPATWQAHADKFVDHCHQALLTRPQTIEYLAGRGVPLALVEKYRLGLNFDPSGGEKQWQPTFRPCQSWGMAGEAKNGRPRMFVLPAGIVIPYANEKGLRRIRIRLAVPDKHNPKKKYHVVKGSAMDTWLYNAGTGAAIVVETELDGIMIEAEYPEINIAALGALAIKPDQAAARVLFRSHTILNGLDYDGEAPRALAWWARQYPQARRWPVPVGKDPGEAYQQGVDIGEWIRAGLPAAAQLQGTRPASKQPAPASGSELEEFFSILADGNSKIRVYDQGQGIGPICEAEWAFNWPDLRARLSQLLYTPGPVADLLAGLPDGVYGAIALKRLIPSTRHN